MGPLPKERNIVGRHSKSYYKYYTFITLSLTEHFCILCSPSKEGLLEIERCYSLYFTGKETEVQDICLHQHRSSYLESQDSRSSLLTPSLCLFHDISEMWLLSQALYPFVSISITYSISDYETEKKNSQIGICGWAKYSLTKTLTAKLVYQFPS